MMEAVNGQQALLAALLCLLATVAWYFRARRRPSAPADPELKPEPEPECWICYSAVSPEKPDEPLLRGCACRGTAGHVHVSCLARAAGRKKRIWTECPSCKQRYTGELFVELSRAHWALVRERPIASEERLAAANSLAAALQGAGRPAEAAALAEESLAALRAKHGADHPHTLAAMNNLAQIRQAAGELEGAAELAEATLAAYRRTLGPDDSRTLLAANNLGGIKHAQGELPAAARLFEGALAGFTRNQGKDHPDILTATHNLGEPHGHRFGLGSFESQTRAAAHEKVACIWRWVTCTARRCFWRRRSPGGIGRWGLITRRPSAQRARWRNSTRSLASVRRTIIAAAWVASFQECRQQSVRTGLVGAARLPYSEAVLDLRRKVMWPDKPRGKTSLDDWFG